LKNDCFPLNAIFWEKFLFSKFNDASLSELFLKLSMWFVFKLCFSPEIEDG